MKFKVSYSDDGKIKLVFFPQDEKESLGLCNVEVKDVDVSFEDGVVTVKPFSGEFLPPKVFNNYLSGIEELGVINESQHQEYIKTYQLHFSHLRIGYNKDLYTDLYFNILNIKDASALKELEKKLQEEKGYLYGETLIASNNKLEFYMSALTEWNNYFSSISILIVDQKVRLRVESAKGYRKKGLTEENKFLTLSGLVANEILQSDENATLSFFVETFDSFLKTNIDFRTIFSALVFALYFNNHLNIKNLKIVEDIAQGERRYLMDHSSGCYLPNYSYIFTQKLDSIESLSTFVHECLHYLLYLDINNKLFPFFDNVDESFKQKWTEIAKTIREENSGDLSSVFNLDDYNDFKLSKELAVRIFQFIFLKLHFKLQGEISKNVEVNEFCLNFYAFFLNLCKSKVLSYCALFGLNIIPEFQELFDLFSGKEISITDNKVLIECVKNNKCFLTYYLDTLDEFAADSLIKQLINQKDFDVNLLCNLFYYEDRVKFLAQLICHLPEDFQIDLLKINNNSVIHYLCEQCSDANLLDKVLTKFPEFLKMMDDGGNLPMHTVLKNRTLACVRSVLEKSEENNIDLNIQNMRGNNLIILAVFLKRDDLLELISLLLSFKRIIPHQQNSAGCNALHIACWHGRYSVAKLLIEEKLCSLTVVDIEGNNYLHYACRKKRFKITELLLSVSRKLADEKNYEGCLPTNLIQDEEFKEKYFKLLNGDELKEVDFFKQEFSLRFFPATISENSQSSVVPATSESASESKPTQTGSLTPNNNNN